MSQGVIVMKVTDYVAAFWAEQGVDTIFGYQGSSIAHMIDSIARNEQIRFIETRHEQGAAFAASAYAKAGKALGVALACSGPGALNLITGVADAFYDSVPVVFITGQVSQKEMKRNLQIRQYGFQETDIVHIVRPITKFSIRVENADDVPGLLEIAVKISLSGRPGPVLLDFPHNIQGSQIDVNCAPKNIINELVLQERNVDGETVSRTLKKLCRAKRPVFLLGGGCHISKSTQKKLELLGVPVVVSYRGKNSYDNKLTNYCGVVGVYGDRAANWCVKFSDYLLCLGNRLDGRQTAGEKIQLQEKELVTVVDIDRHELDKLSDNYTKVNADAESFLIALLGNIETSVYNWRRWLSCVSSWRSSYPIDREYALTDFVNPNMLFHKISKSLCDFAAVTADVGQNQIWANTSFFISMNQRLLQSCGLGAMGYSLPAAIGAYYAGFKQVISINGDGGFQMNIQELQTIQKNKLPIKIFVLNNKSLGLIRDYQNKALGNRRFGSVDGFGSPNYRQIAIAYGLNYICLSDNKHIDEVIDLLDSDEAVLIEVLISEESITAPEPTYGKSIMKQTPEITKEEWKKIEEQVSSI